MNSDAPIFSALQRKAMSPLGALCQGGSFTLSNVEHVLMKEPDETSNCYIHGTVDEVEFFLYEQELEYIHRDGSGYTSFEPVDFASQDLLVEKFIDLLTAEMQRR